VAPATVLEVQAENFVAYVGDVSDVLKFATEPGVTTVSAIGPRNFGTTLAIADIVAVNGKPAKGTVVINMRTITLSAAPTPGQAISDTARGASSNYALEIQQADGTPVGNIYASGFSGGAPPPGAPLAVAGSNNAVVGGTGAFVGVRGQLGGGQGASIRLASITEDPTNRRTNGGGRLTVVVTLIPMSRPEIVTAASGPAIFHADFSPVTAAKPAKAGEVLIVRATGLGPTRPGVDPGKPFPTEAPQDVNSPVGVTVNGNSVDVINKVGWPGMLDTYRVDFRAPDGIAAGTATIQLTAAWIAGPSVNIPAQ
jgi:hypothetical protein